MRAKTRIRAGVVAAAIALLGALGPGVSTVATATTPGPSASECPVGEILTSDGCCDPAQKFCCATSFCNAKAKDPGQQGSTGDSGKQTTTGGPGCTPPTGPGIPPGVDCSGCTWQRTYSIPAPGPHASNFEQMQEVFQKWQASDPKGILDLLTCYPGGAQHLMFFQITARPPNAPSQGMLAAEAQSALLFPTITPHLGPDWSTSANYPMATVNVLEQLWLDPTDFTELQAVADDGIQKVTAVAQPNNVTWDMGDGGPHSVFTCPDAGTPWQNHTMPSGCVYTYRHSSANQPQKDITDPNDRPYHVTVTVDYTITWTCVSDNPDIDPDACGGDTGGTVVHHNSADWDLVVGEIQAVNY